MKWLVYFLLLVNLGVFVWHYQPGRNLPRKTIVEHPNRLVLLREYQQQAPPEDGASTTVCFSLGPFTRREAARAAQIQLEEAGIEVFRRVNSETVRNGYWVLLPVAASANQAQVQIQKLKENGVKDYFLVATGEMKNAISLGVFSKPKLAKRRRDEVAKLGFEVKIRKIVIPKRVYWLEWPRRAKPQPASRLLEELSQRYTGIGQTERPCSRRGKS